MLTIEQCQKARKAKDPRFDGKFFILVKTTGIFCRPVCKVRAPLEKNVEYATSAIEAMRLGYRPCLRCRPESAPESSAWQGVHTTSKRAAHLLSTRHALSIHEVAERLGISTRYLHKLMKTHFQLHPKQFRIYQQVLLAKKLLQSSHMSIEQVASGAGFSSARQMQHHFKKTLDLTPTQTRANAMNFTSKKPAGHDNTTEKAISIRLPFQGEYDWPMLRSFFERRLIKNNEYMADDCFIKTLNICEQSVKVEMYQKTKKSHFDIRFDAMHIAHTSEIIKQVSHILDLHANPFVIFDAIKSTGLKDEHINYGLRIPGISSRFEAGVRAILGQQVSVQAAITQLNRLQQGLCGESEQLFTPSQVISSDLAFLKLPASRKAALKHFAQLMEDDEHADFEQWLNIKGIGPWTVNYVRLRATDDTDIWLNTDLIIKQRIQSLQDAKVAFKDENAAPWRSYLTLSLWNLS